MMWIDYYARHGYAQMRQKQTNTKRENKARKGNKWNLYVCFFVERELMHRRGGAPLLYSGLTLPSWCGLFMRDMHTRGQPLSPEYRRTTMPTIADTFPRPTLTMSAKQACACVWTCGDIPLHYLHISPTLERSHIPGVADNKTAHRQPLLLRRISFS